MHFIRRRFLSPSLVHLVAWLCACLPLWTAASTHAQSDQEILVVSGEKVADNVSEAVSEALGDVGSVMSPSSYTSKLRGREPDSDEALTQVAPQTGASLVVVLRHARSRVKVELRSGRDGKIVGRASVPGRAKRPQLAKPARKKLVAAAKRALKKVGPAPRKPVTSDDSDFADEPTTPTPSSSRAAATQTRPVQPVRPVAPVQQASDDDDEGEDEEESFSPDQGQDNELADDESPERGKSKASSEGGMAIRLYAGLGLGSRSILVPTPPGKGIGNKVDTSFVPALDLGAALELPLGPKWVLRFAADYRTILGLSAGYLTSTNMMATSSLSSHSLIAGASLGRLSDGRDSFGVHVFLGWAYRGLSSDQASLPSASIQGLALRPEVEIPIWDRKLTLRLAPELIVILVPNATLPANDSALAKAVGYGFGGEISLDLHLSQTFGLSAQFRESHGSTPSGWGISAVENERYLALRLLLQF